MLPNFRATIGTAGGERLVVEQEAPSAQALAEEFAARGMYVIDIIPVKTTGRAIWQALTDRFSQGDLLELTRSLRTLIKAGLPVYQALELINEDEESPFRKRLVGGVLHDLAHGLSLSEALAKRPSCFPVFYVRTIQASEATGTLEGTLGDLARVIKRSQKVKDKIFSAAIYPSVLLLLIIGVIFLMLGFVLPRMEVFFLGMGVDLPWDTQMLLAASRWMTSHVLHCLVFFCAACYLIWRVYTEPTLRPTFDSWRYRAPILGSLARMADLALVSRTVAALVNSGIPANEALQTAEETTNNSVLKGQVLETRQRIERGEAMSSAARRAKLLDGRSCRVLRVGEESGSMAQSFNELSDYCEEQLEAGTERFLALMEPFMVVIIGLLIMVVLITMLRPMFESMSRL